MENGFCSDWTGLDSFEVARSLCFSFFLFTLFLALGNASFLDHFTKQPGKQNFK